VTFYGSLSESSQSVQKRTLAYSSTGSGSLTQSVVDGVPTPAYPQMSFSGAAAATTLLTNVKPVLDGTPPATTNRPIFKYYRYKPGAPVGDLELLPAPVSTTYLGGIALIKVAFRSYAARPINEDNDAAQLENDVYIRISDSSEVQEAPQCI
jgi:hypothetical protein